MQSMLQFYEYEQPIFFRCHISEPSLTRARLGTAANFRGSRDLEYIQDFDIRAVSPLSWSSGLPTKH